MTIDSLRALLAGTIDYAGLFPPASLSLEETVRNYLAYRELPESWMLGRLVCPAGRLHDLASLVSGVQDKLHVAALVRGGDSPEVFGENLQSDLTAIGQSRDKLSVGVAEFRVPASFVLSVGRDGVLDLLAMIDRGLREQSPEATGYLELSDWPRTTPLVEWQRVTKNFIVAIADLNRREEQPHRPLGFKLRTGGVEAAAFPTPEQVATVIVACRDAGISWKATAGLHHPMRHDDKSLHVKMHGFLNVLAASVLADACQLSVGEVQSILDDEWVESFRFDDETLHWNRRCANIEQIEAARLNSLVSFGSCSFDEPLQDLRACGLLPAE